MLNPNIDYRVKITITKFEAETILNCLIQYYNHLEDKNQYFYEMISAILIGYRLFYNLVRKFESRELQYSIEGRPKHPKPLKMTLNKLEMIWLYHFAGDLNLHDLCVNRLGIHIINDIPKTN